MIKHKCCECNIRAVWYYMPDYEDKVEKENYYCEDHVPRGCSCNSRYTNSDIGDDDCEIPTDEDKPWKWKDEEKGEWCLIDEENREHPCCEYWYSESGFDNTIYIRAMKQRLGG